MSNTNHTEVSGVLREVSMEDVADMINDGNILVRLDLGAADVYQVEHPELGTVICGIGSNAKGFVVN